MRVILKGIVWVLKVMLGMIGAILYLPTIALVWLYELGDTAWWNIESAIGDWVYAYQQKRAENQAHAADAEYEVASPVRRGTIPRDDYDKHVCECGHQRMEHYGGPETEECAVCPCEGFIYDPSEEMEDIPLSEQRVPMTDPPFGNM